MTPENLLEAIAYRYIESAKRDEFNGVVGSALLKLEPDARILRSVIAGLIEDGRISAVFTRTSVNMHIKRFPDFPIADQLALLESEPLGETCLYPAGAVVSERVDLSTWHDRPFTKALVLAEPQLSFRAFDMGALERYVSDPRYVIHFNDYMGGMSVADEFFLDGTHPKRDKVSLQTFGLGFDDERNPYAVVYLRYLSGLSAEHQQYWNSFLATAEVRISYAYFQSSIEGQFWKNRSVRHAIAEEMRLIRTLTTAIWGRSLFREQPDGNVPIGLTSFLRPTNENFNRFVMALDKLLSDSIDVKFFYGKVLLETESERPDGKVVVRAKGTLALLEEWLLQEIVWDDPQALRDVVIKPLRQIRRLRQTPAHTVTKDVFSAELQTKRRHILWDVFNSLSNMRTTFAKHPQATDVEIPKWLDDETIDVF